MRSVPGRPKAAPVIMTLREAVGGLGAWYEAPTGELWEISFVFTVPPSAAAGKISPVVIDRLPLPPDRLRGMYSSSTAWKLAPPKPKELTPARRTPPAGTFHGLSSVLT